MKEREKKKSITERKEKKKQQKNEKEKNERKQKKEKKKETLALNSVRINAGLENNFDFILPYSSI